jgi:(p)ppGpp synthase/HD superfamily hydrolase
MVWHRAKRNSFVTPFIFQKLIHMATLERAIALAVEAHKGQKDRYGAPYIGHVLRVALAGRTEEERIVGALHDLVEDTEWTFEDLRREGFSEAVLAAVECLTRREAENYEDFTQRVRTNPLAIRVKLNDLTDNMDIRRIPEVQEYDLERLNKYLSAYRELVELL